MDLDKLKYNKSKTKRSMNSTQQSTFKLKAEVDFTKETVDDIQVVSKVIQPTYGVTLSHLEMKDDDITDSHTGMDMYNVKD